MYCAKTAELIEMLFAVLARVGPRNHALDGGQDSRSPMGRGNVGIYSVIEKHWESLLWCMQHKGSFSDQ